LELLERFASFICDHATKQGAPMTKASQYRVFAQECKELASKMNEENKERLLKIAEAWENCAREAEARGEALGE
jgi:hypothetical protein